jgi:hypothetical protein
MREPVRSVYLTALVLILALLPFAAAAEGQGPRVLLKITSFSGFLHALPTRWPIMAEEIQKQYRGMTDA